MHSERDFLTYSHQQGLKSFIQWISTGISQSSFTIVSTNACKYLKKVTGAKKKKRKKKKKNGKKKEKWIRISFHRRAEESTVNVAIQTRPFASYVFLPV